MKFKTLRGTDVREYTVNMEFRTIFYMVHVSVPVYDEHGKRDVVELNCRDSMCVMIGNRHYDLMKLKDFNDMKCMFGMLLENERTKTAIESLD